MHSSLHQPLLIETALAIVPVFAMMAIGVIARRSRLLERTDAAALTRFAIDIALPALVLSALATKHFVAAYLLLPVIMWIAQALCWGCALGASRLLHLKRHSSGTMVLSTFGNTGFMGYPMTTALFPALLPATVFIDQLGMSILLYPVAVILGAVFGESDKDSTNLWSEIGRQLRSPLFISLPVGLLLHALFSYAPSLESAEPVRLALSTVEIVGAATIPVVMIAVGMRLSAGAARRSLGPIGALGVIKLILLPVFCFVCGRFLFHLHGNLLSVSVLEGAMPPAATGTVFAARYRMDSDLAVASFFVLTVASAVTVPILISVLR